MGSEISCLGLILSPIQLFRHLLNNLVDLNDSALNKFMIGKCVEYSQSKEMQFAVQQVFQPPYHFFYKFLLITVRSELQHIDWRFLLKARG